MGRGRSKRKSAETNRRPRCGGSACSCDGGRVNRCGGCRGPRRPCASLWRLKRLRPRITTLGVGAGTGCGTGLAYFCSRAFRFTRKGYAASVRQQSCQRLPRCRARHEINSNRFSAATCAPSRGASLARCGAIHLLAENSLREVETGEVPPAAETASRFRGSGTIGAPARARQS